MRFPWTINTLYPIELMYSKIIERPGPEPRRFPKAGLLGGSGGARGVCLDSFSSLSGERLFRVPGVQEKQDDGREDRDQVFARWIDRDQRIEREPVEKRLGRICRQDRVERVRRALDRDV